MADAIVHEHFKWKRSWSLSVWSYDLVKESGNFWKHALEPRMAPAARPNTVGKNLRGRELAQHKRKNTAVVEIFEFVERRYAAEQGQRRPPAVSKFDLGLHRLARLQ